MDEDGKFVRYKRAALDLGSLIQPPSTPLLFYVHLSSSSPPPLEEK
jgi:hypothetical protein